MLAANSIFENSWQAKPDMTLLSSSLWHLFYITQVGAAPVRPELFLLMWANLFPLALETLRLWKEGQR